MQACPSNLVAGKNSSALIDIYLTIHPRKIGFLKFLFEGYDGLATLSTLDVKNGLVKLNLLRSRYREALYLLSALCCEYQLN